MKHEKLKIVFNELIRVRCDYTLALDSYERAVTAACIIFGAEPHKCLWCGTPKLPASWRVNDLDRWFCSKCCPICNGWPDER